MKLRSLLSVPATLVLAAGVLASAGCGKRETAVQSGNREQIIHIGNLSEPVAIDPQIISSHQDFNVVMAFFEGLLQYDPKTCEPTPAVAERYEVSPDNLTWTFHLRHNAKWSNGDPVTAHDFVFAYQRMLSPGLAAEYANMLFVLKNAEAYYTKKITDRAQVGARAADDHTLVLTLNNPAPYLPTMVCHSSWYPVHRPTIEKFGKVDDRTNPWTKQGNLVGNGYFTLAEWRPNQHIRGIKSQTYWDRDKVRLKEVFFYPIESADAEERAFRSGQLHVTSTLPISKTDVYAKDSSGVFQPHTFLATYVFRFNVNVPPLTDARVRRALAMAIDRESLVRDVLRNAGQIPAGSFCPPNIAGFTARKGIATDIPSARKLLAEAGFPEGKGFPKLDLLFNTNEGHRQIAEALQQMWKKNLGIDIGLYNQEAKVWNDSMRTLNYQIGRFAWVGDYLDPSTFLDIMTTGNGNNQTGWGSAEYDQMIDAARNTADTTKRYEYYQRCEEILAEEVPMAPVYYYSRNNLRRPEVKGWYGNLLDDHPLKGVYIEAPGT